MKGGMIKSIRKEHVLFVVVAICAFIASLKACSSPPAPWIVSDPPKTEEKN